MRDRFLKLNAGFFKHAYWQQKRTYSFAEAWLDLIWNARFEAKPISKIVSRNRTIEIKRGEIHASLRFLAERWGWTKERVQRFLAAAKERGELIQETRQGETIITLCNFAKYNSYQDTDQDEDQDEDKDTDQDKYIERVERVESIEGKCARKCAPPSPQPPPVMENLENRKKAFMAACAAYVETYGKAMMRAFFDFWTEPNKSNSKMRFELEKTWSLERRLKTWSDNELKFNRNGNDRKCSTKRGCNDEELTDAIFQGIARGRHIAENNQG
jgi:hypothetical protein